MKCSTAIPYLYTDSVLWRAFWAMCLSRYVYFMIRLIVLQLFMGKTSFWHHMYRDNFVPLLVLPSNFDTCLQHISLAIFTCNWTLPKTKTNQFISSLYDLIIFEKFITSQDYDGFCQKLKQLRLKFIFFFEKKWLYDNK